jgi:hypothetical protein
MNWISVKDKLPEPLLEVLFYSKEGQFYDMCSGQFPDKNRSGCAGHRQTGYFIGFYNGFVWKDESRSADTVVKGVTHWMPIEIPE